MAAYRKDVSIVFPVSLEPSGWMQDTLPMPKCLAGWLTANGFSGPVEVVVSCTVRGRHSGFDSDDSHEFVCHGGRVGQTVIPPTVLNCALDSDWEDHFASELMDARNAACVGY